MADLERVEASESGGVIRFTRPGPGWTTCARPGARAGYGEAVTVAIRLPDADVEAFRAWLAAITAETATFELGIGAYGAA
ncbi:DUF1949 domain-containing protein [Streptomyces canus]|uniref:DUF1949 domain-containing protein n=1 Tax=Streptomyces canus TaxID=58343 RepID=UPI00352EEA24